LLKTVLYPEAGRSTAFSFGRWCSFILKIFLLKFEKLNGILLFFSSSSGANIPQWAPTHFMGHFSEKLFTEFASFNGFLFFSNSCRVIIPTFGR